MNPTVFIETTIPSFYFETRADPTIVARRVSTRNWWSQWRSRYQLVTSEGVLAELGRAPEPKRQRMLTFMKAVEVLAEPAGLDRIVTRYIADKLMPRDAEGDAPRIRQPDRSGVPADVELPSPREPGQG